MVTVTFEKKVIFSLPYFFAVRVIGNEQFFMFTLEIREFFTSRIFQYLKMTSEIVNPEISSLSYSPIDQNNKPQALKSSQLLPLKLSWWHLRCELGFFSLFFREHISIGNEIWNFLYQLLSSI